MTSVADRKCFDAHLNELVNYVDKAKCRHTKKNCPLKGLCGRCLQTGDTFNRVSISTPICELLPLSPSPLYLKMLIDVWLSYLIGYWGELDLL